ncbi:hypothetical protein KMT30_44875, partial [Streptomyces sp. IBSBF 2953]|nr:hypothetical protein [Streptomyces hayashii]
PPPGAPPANCRQPCRRSPAFGPAVAARRRARRWNAERRESGPHVARAARARGTRDATSVM